MVSDRLFDRACNDLQTQTKKVFELEKMNTALRARVARLEEAMQKIADGRGMIPDNSTIYMSGKVPEVPKHFNMYDMREIARRALEDK